MSTAATDTTTQTIPDTIYTTDLADTELGSYLSQVFSQDSSEVTVFFNLAVLVGIAAAAYLISHFLVRKIIQLLAKNSTTFSSAAFSDSGVLKNLSKMLPWIIIQIGITLVPNLNSSFSIVIRNVATALAILYGTRMIAAFLESIILYNAKKQSSRLSSIKTYVQLGKIIVYVLGCILIVAALIDRSPVILISGLGAMSAVTMLVFKDTLLSFVAGIQISSNNMLRVGDWIEMPQVGADGTVIDIALHTVRVQNFDRTIVTIPTWRLISESFRNYRGMYESNGRRIKRSLFIDINSIKFMNKEDLKRLSQVNVLKSYLSDKLTEIEKYNYAINENEEFGMNRRRLTNLGTFRAYTLAYLRAHPMIRNDLSLMVRQMQPGAEGQPLEIYCFTNTTVWSDYENIQSDIFDHLYSIIGEFGLRPFQQISGYDIAQSFTSARQQENH